MKDKLLNWLILCLTVLFIIGLDRLLLTTINPPLWISDEKLHYKHRPLAVSDWTAFGNDKPLRINSHGQHDDEFPVQKPPRELRLLCLGDSVTMGHGVTREETYANQLEQLLLASELDFASYQVINAGVQGYTTFQELEMLRRSLIFEPDYITVGFVMNDITEPLVVDRNFGGTGFDYHEVFQTSSRFLDYLLNNTGLGRLAVKTQYRLMGDPIEARLHEIYNVERMVKTRGYQTDEKIRQNWAIVLEDLSQLYRLAQAQNIDITLLIFPYTFQLNNPAMQWPQQLLKAHAHRHEVDYIDFTALFEERLANGQGDIEDYFLDEDHLTVKGHTVVAEYLLLHLHSKLDLKLALDSPPARQGYTTP